MIKFSIIIPTYNEKSTIRSIIDKIQKVGLDGAVKEIIVVDDGSNDGTRDILKTIPGILYIFHEKNLGKGGAVKTGFKNSTGDILIVQDADLEYDPEDFSALVAPILSGAVQVTNGVRIKPQNDPRKGSMTYIFHWLGNGLITWTTNLLYWHYSAEYEACYKAFTKKLIDSIEVRTNNFDFDNELVCKILKRGYKIVDVPVRYYPRGYEEGKKINWKHGFLILWTIVKCRFVD